MSPYHSNPRGPGGLTPEELAAYYRQLMSLGQGVAPPVRFQTPWDPVTSVQSQEEISLGRTRRREDAVPNPMLRGEGESRVDHAMRVKGYEEAQRLGQETPLGYGQPEPQTIGELTQAFADAPRQLDMYGQEKNVLAAFDKPGSGARGVGEGATGFVGRNVAGALKLGGRMLPGDPADPSTIGSSVVGAADRLREYERGRAEDFQDQFRSVINPEVAYDKPGWTTAGEIATGFALEGSKYIIGGQAVRSLGAKGVAMIAGTRAGQATAAALTARFVKPAQKAWQGAPAIVRAYPGTTAAATAAATAGGIGAVLPAETGTERLERGATWAAMAAAGTLALKLGPEPLKDVLAFLPLDILTTQYDEDSIAFVAEMFTSPEIQEQFRQDPESFYSEHLTGDLAQRGMNKLNEMAAKAMESEIGKAKFEAGFGWAADIALRSGFRAIKGTVQGARTIGRLSTDPSAVDPVLAGAFDPEAARIMLDDAALSGRIDEALHPVTPLDEALGVSSPEPWVRAAERAEVVRAAEQVRRPPEVRELAPARPQVEPALGRTLEGPKIGPELRRDPESGLILDEETGLPLVGTSERIPGETGVKLVGPPQRIPGEVDTGLEGRWYSRLQATLEGGPGKATGADWAKYLYQQQRTNPPAPKMLDPTTYRFDDPRGHEFAPRPKAFSQNEGEWTGIREYLDSNRNEVLTRGEVLGHARDNEIRLKEITKGAAALKVGSRVQIPPHPEPSPLRSSTWSEGVVEEVAQDGTLAVRRDDTGELQGGVDPRSLGWHGRAYQDGHSMPKFEAQTQGQFGIDPASNYEEILIQLDRPARTDQVALEAELAELRARQGRATEPGTADDVFQGIQHRRAGDEELSTTQVRIDEIEGVLSGRDRSQYTGGHWDEPDVMAHIRKTERPVTVRGVPGKSYHIEELQSDPLQKARDVGFSDPASADATKGRRLELFARMEELESEMGMRAGGDGEYQDLSAEYGRLVADAEGAGRGIPNMPYKKTSEWVRLAASRAFQGAIDSGLDRISWATGAQAADLNSLRHRVSEISYNETSGTLEAWDLEGGRAVHETGITPGQLPEHIGKEPAQRLMDTDVDAAEYEVREFPHATTGEPVFAIREVGRGEYGAYPSTRRTRAEAEEYIERLGQARSIEGDDLTVGGEGMITFYDQIVKNEMRQLAKEVGGVIEEVDVIPSDKGAPRIVEFEGIDPDVPEGPWGPSWDDGVPRFKWVDAEGYTIERDARELDPDQLKTGTKFETRADAEKWGAEQLALGDERFVAGERNPSIEITPEVRERWHEGEGARGGQGARGGGRRLATPAPIVGAALGGTVGAVTPADSEQERWDNILKGVIRGGLGGAVAGGLRGRPRMPTNAMATGVPIVPRAAKLKGPPGQAPTSSRYIRIPDEKVATNVKSQANIRAKSAAGKRVPGNPSNPRTVIRAAPGSGNPDVVVGDITQLDWIERTESLLNPKEIVKAAKWYQEVFPQFEKAAGGDAEEIKKLVAAWLSANQNQSPENALKQVLRVREYVLRGVPHDQLPAAGLPGVTKAVHAILTGKQATTVGPKISDFFDSAEGRTLRTWMGMDPGGGAPFVVDIHTARDTGLVDEKLVNMLKAKGYDGEALDRLQWEKPSGAKYENRAEFGRALTDHLNAVAWQGRSDWSATEIQAVGWAAMRRVTGDAEAGVQGMDAVIEQSTRRIAFEVLPGKGSAWDKKFGPRLSVLPQPELAAVTREVGEDAFRRAARVTGVKDLAAVVHSLGGWMDAVTPNIAGRFIASREGMDAMTARLGYYLDQTEVLGSTLRPNIEKPTAYAVDFLEVGTKTLRDDAALQKFWKVIQDADDAGTFKGFTPVEYPDGSTGVRVLFDLSYGSKDIGGRGADKLRASLKPGGAIDTALRGLDIDVESELFQTELSKSVNDFKEAPDGQAHIQRLTDITGGGPTATDLLNRKELTRSLEEALGAAEGRAAEAGGARAGVDPGTTPAAKGEPGEKQHKDVGIRVHSAVQPDMPGTVVGVNTEGGPPLYEVEFDNGTTDLLSEDELVHEGPDSVRRDLRGTVSGARAGVDPGTTLGLGLGGASRAQLAGAARVGGKAAVGGLVGGLLDASVGEDSPVEGVYMGMAAALAPSLVRGLKNLRVRAEVADDAIDSALQQTLAAEQIAREAPEMMEGAPATATPPPEGEVPPRTTAADKIDPEEFVNIKKFGLEPGSTEERLKEAVQEVVDQTGMDPKEVVTHEQTIRIAESLGLDAQDITRRLGGAGGAPAGADMLAARNIISANVRRIDELFQQLKANNIHIDSDEAAPYVAQINVLQGETNGLLATYMPASSATGRALNAMKIAAQDSMDPATWVIRAAKVSGVAELPPSIAAEITRLTTAKDKQGLMKLLANLQKSDISEQIVTLGKAAMLSGLPTHAMNLMSTAYNVFGIEHLKDLPASWFDSLLSSWAGTQRTKSWGSVAAQLDAGKRGAQQGIESARDVLHGRMPEGSLERWDQIRQVNIDLVQRTPLLKHVPVMPKIIDRSLDIFQKTTFGALGAGDALLTGFAVQRSLAEQARVIAMNEGLKGPELAARAAVILAEETTPEMMLESVAQGMLATFRNQGIVGTGISGLKRGIRQTAKKVGGLAGVGDPAHTATYMATEALIPWSMTPANVVTRVAEASPLGAVSVATNPYFWKLLTKQVTKDTESAAAQKLIVERLGRSTVGAAPVLLGIYLYNEGLLSLGWMQSKAGQRELTGEEENAWKIGDTWVSMERMSPGGNLVILGGYIADEWQKARRDADSGLATDIGTTALGGGLSIARTAYEQSFLEGLRSFGETLTSTERETGRENLFAGTASMFVPNILKRLNRWADPTMRVRETVGDQLLQGVPGGARLAGKPARVDPFGETRKYREGFYSTMVDPFQLSRDKTLDSPVRAMMRDLDISISRRRKMDEETAQEYEQRQRLEGKALEAAITSLIGSSEFLSVRQQADAAMPPGTDAKTLELVTKAVQAEMVEGLITSERTKYTRSYREYLGSRQLTGAGR